MKHFLILACMICALTACQPIVPQAESAPQPPAPAATPEADVPPVTLEPTGFIRNIHDPVMAKEGDTYYVFSTGSRIVIICSKDMVEWEFCGRVFERNPAWVAQAIPGVRDLWAPDISYFNDKWHLYYSGSTFGSNRSVIGLATNVTLDPNSPDYRWVDEGQVIASQTSDDWNAIDPNLVIDEGGQPWLAFGSYWSGIKLRKIDADTGKLAADDATPHSLANRRGGPDNTTAIEAAYILHHGDYYYLFVSFDQCCQGAASTYNGRVGRSQEIVGPYLDRDGVPMLAGGGTKILSAYGKWKGPGHNGIFQEDDVAWIVYHAYDSQHNGISKLRIEPIQWDEDGWPVLPSAALVDPS